MAKPLPLIIGGVGLTGAAAGGVFLVRGGGSKPGDGNTAQTKTTENNSQPAGTALHAPAPAAQAEPFFGDVNGFKADAKSSKCVSEYFGSGFTIGSGGSDFGSSSPASNTFFKTEPQDHKSCLIIQWKKKEQVNGDKKWNGKFTWLWTFIKGDEGFINFNVIEPSDTDKQPKFTGAFYLVGKASDGNSWEVKNKKEVANGSKKVAKNDWDNYFPKAHNDVKGDKNDYWGFMDNADKVDKICKTGNSDTCSTITLGDAEVTRLKWTAAKSTTTGAKSIWDWSSSSDWWNKIYEVNDWKLKEKLAQFKGTWTRSQ